MLADGKTMPSLGQTLIPILFLIGMLSASVYLFADDSSYGPNQIALILTAGVASIIGWRNGFNWKEMRDGMVESVSMASGALFILLAVGSLIGTWIMAGVVPAMIYYGLQILDPSIFYGASVIVCAIVAVATGSSWTTASTIGIALVGVAAALNLDLGITAGAIISGAYFGDKMSPLSDTTNLAPAMAGTDLFTHIRHMAYTTIPSLVISLIIFFMIGFFSETTTEAANLGSILTSLTDSYNIGLHLMIPPALVIGLVIYKVPAFPAILIGALVGGIFAMIFQPEVVLAFAGYAGEGNEFVYLLKGFWKALYAEFSISTGSSELDDLLSRGGMASMMNTLWLIISAMMFGGVLEKIGMLETLAASILKFAKSTGSLILATLSTAIGLNLIASDQYVAIVVPGRMYRAEFARRKLHPKNLSRALEDAGTLTSPMIPWNTCGAFMAGALGVATGTYWMFCFFNMLNPVISAIYGFTGFTIEKIDPAEEEALLVA